MPDGQFQHETLPAAGRPWIGVDETGESSDVVDCLNMDFDDRDGMRRRPGRQVIATLDLDRGVTGLFEHVEENGARSILVALQAANPLDADPRFGTLTDGTNVLADLALPAAPTDVLRDPREFTAVAYRGRLIIADQSAQLLDYDGESLSALAAADGKDKTDGVPGARGYLATPPRARAVGVWRNRIVTLDGYRVGLSADSGDLTVPDATKAPAGGANVWPSDTYFYVVSPQGDPLQGFAIQHDLLVLFTRRTISVVDEDAVSPVARVVEKQNGCVAPRSIQTVGGDRILYLADGKVCSFSNGVSVDVSKPVSRTLRDLVNWQAAGNAVSAHLPSRNEYRIWLPVNGGASNRLCLVYDYARNRWKRYAGWFPWDTEERQAAQPFDVTAALAVLTAGNEEILLTGDSSGRIWREDVGETDAGAIFPAYAAMRPIGSDQRKVTWGAWRVEAAFDGSHVEGFALRDGVPFEQEVVRVLEGLATKCGRKHKAALARGHKTWDADDLAWGVDPHTIRFDRLRLPFRAKAARLQPVLSLPGTDGTGGVAEIPERGGIRSVEIAFRAGEGRRGPA